MANSYKSFETSTTNVSNIFNTFSKCQISYYNFSKYTFFERTPQFLNIFERLN